MNFLTNLNLGQNQIQNAVIQPLTVAPSGIEGQIYYDTTIHALCVRGASGWEQVGKTYTLPIASATVLGGVKIGAGLTIDAQGVLTAAVGGLIDAIQFNGAALPITNKTVNILISAGTGNGQIKLNGTDTTIYTHPTADGSLHVPANGTANTGRILTAGSTAGVYTWELNAPLWANIQNKPTSAVADIDSAVSLKHAQNTDVGTSSATFYLGATGIKLKNVSNTELQVRNNGDTAFANLRVGNLYVEGTQTIIHSTEVDIGDTNILLNADITTSAANSNGGISVKRLMADNTTRKDAVLEYNVSTNRWQSTFGFITEALTTAPLTNKKVETIGNGTDKTFTITHNFGTRDIAVAVRETNDDYELVLADIKFPNINSITITFAVAPTNGQYTVTLVG